MQEVAVFRTALVILKEFLEANAVSTYIAHSPSLFSISTGDG